MHYKKMINKEANSFGILKEQFPNKECDLYVKPV